MARVIAGDAELRFRLCGNRRMRNQGCENSLRNGWHKRIAMNYRNSSRAIRAFLGRGLELRITAGKLSALRHAHHAMMFSVSAAARRQVRLALAGHRQERLDKRQAQKGQQRDGEKSPQC